MEQPLFECTMWLDTHKVQVFKDRIVYMHGWPIRKHIVLLIKQVVATHINPWKAEVVVDTSGGSKYNFFVKGKYREPLRDAIVKAQSELL